MNISNAINVAVGAIISKVQGVAPPLAGVILAR